MKISYSKPEIIELSATHSKSEQKEIQNSKPSKLLDNWHLIFLLIPIYVIYTFLYVPYQKENKLLEKGILATGTLLKVEETGNTFNDKPELNLFFEVLNSKGEKWKATATQVISFVDLYKIIPGNKFQVKYNPENKSEILILDNKINFETTN